MRRLLQYFTLMVILLLTIIFFSPREVSRPPKTASNGTFLASPFASLTPQSSPETPNLSCVDEAKISDVSGKKFSLIRENYFPETLLLECSYQGADQINNISPSLTYTLHQLSAAELPTRWSETRTQIQQKSSHRVIVGKEYLIADVNPVFEVRFVTFYGFDDNTLMQLTYSPIKAETGQLLDLGTKLSDLVLGK